MIKNYSLIVSGDSSFSLICDADQDGMTDYFPGIWCISTQKRAIHYAQEELNRGNTVQVRNYNNAKHYALSNKLIKALGLSQPLFEEVKPIASAIVTNGKPTTLGALKKFLTVGTKIKIVHSENPDRSRDTEIIQVKNGSVVTRKGEAGQSHLYFEKASNWSFDNEGATYNYLRDGVYIPSFKIEYITN